MLKALFALCVAASLLSSDEVWSQSEVSLPNTLQWPVHSKINDRDYAVQVALPNGYADSDQPYPTVYLLDANDDFPYVVSISRRLQREDGLANFIIVGVAYETSPRYYRRVDYSHSAVADWESSGGGPDFRRALSEEIIPFIDQKYRTDAGNRALLGHSLGGLFAGYMAIEQPRLFHSYIISSPSVWYDDYSLIAEAKAIAPPIRAFLSVGAEESDHMQISHERLSNYLQDNALLLSKKDVVLGGENHASAKFRAYADGLRWLFK